MHWKKSLKKFKTGYLGQDPIQDTPSCSVCMSSLGFVLFPGSGCVLQQPTASRSPVMWNEGSWIDSIIRKASKYVLLFTSFVISVALVWPCCLVIYQVYLALKTRVPLFAVKRESMKSGDFPLWSRGWYRQDESQVFPLYGRHTGTCRTPCSEVKKAVASLLSTRDQSFFPSQCKQWLQFSAYAICASAFCLTDTSRCLARRIKSYFIS